MSTQMVSTGHQVTPTQSSCLKRRRQDSIVFISIQPRKKQRRVKIGTVSVPLNDPVAHQQAVDKQKIYVFPPSAKIMHEFARKNGLLDIAVYGVHTQDVIERLTLDEETKIPWQITKVLKEFDRLDYTSAKRRDMYWSDFDDDTPVSPKTLPFVDPACFLESGTSSESDGEDNVGESLEASDTEAL